MISFKRLKNDENALALYYTDDNICIRYEIDITLYGQLPALKWSEKQQSLIKSGKMTLAIFIANYGKPIGYGNFLYYVDGNKYNLRQSNLQIISKNTYTINGNETILSICSSVKHINQPIQTIIDTEYTDLLKPFTWGIDGQGYVKTVIPNSAGQIIKLHRYSISLEEELCDGLVVDHIDRNKLNNKRSNLRQVSYNINGSNRIFKKDNPDAILGVCKQDGAWIAHSALRNEFNGNKQWRRFSIKLYGEDKAKQLAIQQRQIWEKELGITSVIIT